MTTPRHLLPIALSAIRSLAAALAIAAAAVAPPALADSETIDGVTWEFTVSDGKATVDGVNPAEGNLVIPGTLGGATVTGITSWAISGKDNLTDVTVPEGLVQIGSYAFNGCDNLAAVHIAESVAQIKYGAFDECTKLAAVHISDLAAWCGIDFWDSDANPLSRAHRLYLDGTELTELSIPDGVASIAFGAFFGWGGVRAVIPDSVTEIGQSAFFGCPSLASVAIGTGVTNVGNYAFADCPQLAAITVAPENAAYAVEGGVLFDKAGTRLVCCPAGKTGAYAVPADVTDLLGGAFYGCAGLASVTLPDGLLAMGFYAFGDCTGLTELAIPGSVTNIGNCAFDGCTGLRKLVIPDSVTDIGNYAFDGCTGLAALEVPAAWYGTAKLANASVPEGCAVTYRGISPLAVATEDLPKGRVGEAYEVKLEATGGVEPYAWSPPAVYTESAAENSFAETGTALGWQGDDDCWDLALPFEFPFFGNSYTNAKINSNGAISFGTDEFRAWAYSERIFKASPIIAVLWKEMATTSGDVYVDSGSDAVTVRWQGTRYGNPVNFSATLWWDGRIVLSYGAGNADGGAIGISAGDGTTYQLSAKNESGSMENAEDIVFGPSWLTVAADGTLGGIPSEAGTLAFAVTVTDGAGVTASRELTLAVEENAFYFGGDMDGMAGTEVFFTVEPKVPGTPFVLAGVTAPEGSSLTLADVATEYPAVRFTPDVEGTYRFAFELTGESQGSGTWSVNVAPGTGPGPGPGTEPFAFGGDSEGTVGQEVRFTVVPTAEGAQAVLALFRPPEGSALGRGDVAADFPEVRFTPDAEGTYRFIFMYAEGTDESGVWTVTVAPEELRITKMEVRGGTVTLGYAGEAKSVEGTDDLAAGDSWRTVAGAAIDAANKTATLPAGKHFLRLSTEEGGGEAEHRGVQLWEGGPFWAETNLGAEKPEDTGLYFWWGDTVGYRREGEAWVASGGASTNFSFDEANTPTYGKDKDQLRSAGWTTAAGVLAPGHDAAQAQWGGSWRMPTDQELKGLNNNCDWTWTSTNGVDGHVVRGRGNFAESSIFVPAAGYGYGTWRDDAGSCVNLWASVPYSEEEDHDFSWKLGTLGSGPDDHGVYLEYRHYGLSVRPVRGAAE